MAIAEFTESGFDFDFSEAVAVSRYDETALHKTMTGTLSGTKGVDFLICGAQLLTFVEVKSFTHGGTKPIDELVDDLMAKLWGSLAGTLVMGLKGTDSIGERLISELGNAFRLGVQSNLGLWFIFWFESHQRMTGGPKKAAHHCGQYQKKLEKKLKWFPGKILVINRQLYLANKDRYDQLTGLRDVRESAGRSTP